MLSRTIPFTRPGDLAWILNERVPKVSRSGVQCAARDHCKRNQRADSGTHDGSHQSNSWSIEKGTR
jgi:hypothetical protein